MTAARPTTTSSVCTSNPVHSPMVTKRPARGPAIEELVSTKTLSGPGASANMTEAKKKTVATSNASIRSRCHQHGLATTSRGLAYDWDNDVLYLTTWQQDSLYTVNVSTGQASLVGANGVENIIGLTYVVPEPSTLALAAIGLLGFLALVWQRRRKR